MNQPNILIFMTDHQRADTALPDHPAITPRLTQLAAEGVSFTQAYCPSPHCCPSRATFFSGLYPSGHGVWNNITNQQALSRGLNDGVRLFSEDLAEAGYDLHYAGKWHVSMHERPADRGWKEHGVSAVVGTRHGPTWEQYRQAAALDDEPSERRQGEIARTGYGPFRLYGSTGEEGFARDEKTIEGALAALDEVEGNEAPWCLYVGLLAPHDPYAVPQRYLDMLDLDDVPLPVNYADSMVDKPRIYKRLREARFGQLSPDDTRDAIRHFWAFCSYIDDLFGQLLDRITELGQLDDTLVIFCSDHGDYCGEHGLFAKGIPCFNGAYHVPLVMRHPKLTPKPGACVDAFVSLADIAPTLLDVAGVETERPFAGASLLPLMQGRVPENWRDAVFTQCNGVELYYSQRSVKTKDYKYVFNGFDDDELYDLRNDPHEIRNLARDPRYNSVIRDMCRRMWRFAYEQADEYLLNSYITVALAPYGPAEAFRD
ncbi:MAG: sulfatase-like hydrolase/transferase [Chloroflexi bacterium]|nr:sulfatase-like hydrolase/transferase [Chloroflexota bacterium]